MANPLSSGLERDPGLGGLALGVLVAVDAQPGGVGEVGAELQEERAEVVVDPVEVVVVDHRGRRHDPRVGRTGVRVVAALGAEDAGLLLGDPDEQDPVGVGAPGQVFAHHLVLALPLREVQQRHVVGCGEVVDVGDELFGHRCDQGGRGDREPAMAHQEPDDLAGALQLRHEDVEVHPVDALDLEPHMIGEHIGCRTG